MESAMEGATPTRTLELRLSSSLSINELPEPPPKKRRLDETGPDLSHLITRIQKADQASDRLRANVEELEEGMDLNKLFDKMMAERLTPQSQEVAREPTTPKFEEGEYEEEKKPDVSLNALWEKVRNVGKVYRNVDKSLDVLEAKLKSKVSKKRPREEESGFGSFSQGAMGSFSLDEEKMEQKLDLIEENKNSLLSRIPLIKEGIGLWQIKTWEKREFISEEEAELFLSSCKRKSEKQQASGKEKVGLHDFTLPNILIPCETVSNMNIVSCGATIAKPGKIGNQDSYFISSDLSFFGVADGHGVQGGEVSQKIRSNMPSIIRDVIKHVDLSNKRAVINALLKTFELMDQDLKDFQRSGSTLCLSVRTPIGLFFGNVGDSKAVIDIKGKAYQITFDQLASEKYCKFDVEKRGTKVEKRRVYPMGMMLTADMGNHFFQIDGLKQLKSFPELYFFPKENIVFGDSFLILASDGLWDNVTPQQAVDALRGRLTIHQDLSLIVKELAAGVFHAGKKRFLDDTTIMLSAL